MSLGKISKNRLNKHDLEKGNQKQKIEKDDDENWDCDEQNEIEKFHD